MTTPTTAFLPTATVWIDGVRMADGCTNWETVTDPVVLTDLKVTWGRNNTLDQPEPGTAVFDVLDIGGGVRAVDLMHIGSLVQIKAEATIYPDPDVPIFTFNPGFEGMVVGATPPSVTQGCTASVTDQGPPNTGTRAVRLEPSLAVPSGMSVIFPPSAFSASPSAWDAVPQTAQGQTWQAGLSVLLVNLLLANQQVTVFPVSFTASTAASAVRLTQHAVTLYPGASGWQDVLIDFEPPSGVWLGVGLEVRPAGGPSWDDLPPTLTWDDLGGADMRTNLATNPGYEVGNGSIYSGSTGNYLLTADTTAPIAGTRSALLTRAGTMSNVVAQITGYVAGQSAAGRLPVTPGQICTGALSVKTDVPSATIATRWYWYDASSVLTQGPETVRATGVTAGQIYRVTETGTAPAGSASALLVVFIRTPSGNAVAGQRVWADMLTLEYGTTDGSYFDGSTPDTLDTRYDWTGTANASTSTASDLRAAPRWDDIGRVFVDDLKLLAPAGGALRSGTVFAGRITDMRAQYDLDKGGTVVQVTAQTHLAELDNRYIGSEPWVKETLANRFSRIVTLSGQDVTYVIDSSVQGRQITWRDVDAQPAGDLLHQLAQSVGGALWSAATNSGNAYAWLEDINNRPAMHTLVKDPDGVVRIHQNAAIGTGARAITLDSCDLDLEPVEWVQTTEDDSTQVVVTWNEQTLDQDGNQKPTTRDVVITDSAAEQQYGRRRVQVSTQLALQTDADSLSQALLARLSAPGWRITGLEWDTAGLDRVTADTLDRFMKVLDGVTRLGLGILLVNVPVWAPPATGEDVWLFLEGGVFTNQGGSWHLELLTSSGDAQGASTVRWDDLPGSITPAATRTNRATNPRAVTGGTAQWGQAGWGTGGNGTTSYITGVTAPTGTNISTAFRKTWTVAATSVQSAALALTGDASNRIPATAGKTYTISVWVRHSGLGASKNYEILLRWFNQVATSGGAQVGADVLGTAVAVSDGTGWTRLSMTATAPAGALAMLVYPRVQAAATGAVAINSTQDGTGLLIEEAAGPVGSYFDGATVDAPPLDYSWSGTANASMSTAVDTTAPFTGWQWDQFDPAITWNDLHGVGV